MGPRKVGRPKKAAREKQMRANIMFQPTQNELLNRLAAANPDLTRSGVIRGLLMLVTPATEKRLSKEAHSAHDVARIIEEALKGD